MKREEIQAAIKSLESKAEGTHEHHLISYLKLNLGNLWELEDDEDLNPGPAEFDPDYPDRRF